MNTQFLDVFLSVNSHCFIIGGNLDFFLLMKYYKYAVYKRIICTFEAKIIVALIMTMLLSYNQNVYLYPRVQYGL